MCGGSVLVAFAGSKIGPEIVSHFALAAHTHSCLTRAGRCCLYLAWPNESFA